MQSLGEKEFQRLLDNHLEVGHHPTLAALDAFIEGVNNFRHVLSFEDWRAVIEAVARKHVLYEVIQQDPFSRRALQKPRRYSGDAVTLDLVYRGLPPDEAARISGVGLTLFTYLMNRRETQGTRNRLDIISTSLDEVMVRQPSAAILSVACGHLRELDKVQAVRNHAATMVAFDQDTDSLAVVQETYGKFGVRTVNGKVRDLLQGSVDLGAFDFIYATGLYDYLPDQAAVTLTHSLFARLRPGGRLLLANVVPGLGLQGYFEAFLDWWMVYRTPKALSRVSDSLPHQLVAGRCDFTEPAGAFAFHEVMRAG